MNAARRFKVADPELGVFAGSTPTQPHRAHQAARAFREQYQARRPPRTGQAAGNPARGRVETLLSLLELQHNTIAAQGSTHETSVEIDRKACQAALESLAMLATGALRATIARPDLVAIASVDSARAYAAAGDAQTTATGPLGKTVAAQLVAAAGTSSALVGAMAGLPGGPAPAPSSPHPAPPREDLPGAAGDDVADVDQGERVRPRSRAGVGLFAGAVLLGALALGRRRR